MKANRLLLAVAVVLLVLDLGLAIFWHPLPPAHERELPAPAHQTAESAIPTR